MFLHLGQNTIVNTRDIIGIFDLDTASVSARTREYLAAAQKTGAVVDVSGELPKSFVVTAERRGHGMVKEKLDQTLFVSQLAAPTLKKRLYAQIRQNKQSIANMHAQ